MVIKQKRVRNFRTRPSHTKTVIIADKLDVFRLRNYSTTIDGEKNDYSFIIERVYEDRYVMNSEEYSARKVLNFDYNTTQSSSWSLDKSQQFDEANFNNGNSSWRKTVTFDFKTAAESSHSFEKSVQFPTTAESSPFLQKSIQINTARESSPFLEERVQVTTTAVSTPLLKKNVQISTAIESSPFLEKRVQFATAVDSSPFLEKSFQINTAGESSHFLEESVLFSTTPYSSPFLGKRAQFIVAAEQARDSVSSLSLQEDTRGSLYYLLSKCDHARVLEWSEFLTQGECKKLGEGVYGEVFQLSLDGIQTAVKIIPFMDKECFHNGLVNGEHMKKSMEILPELLITKELSQLANQNGKDDAPVYSTPSFVQLIKTAVVRGDYPEMLLSQWDKFYKVNQSENDRPDKYSSPNQLFMVFALSLGGKELECYTVKNEKQAFSIFLQVAWSLAVAEETLEFEHRDLHIGNILIKQCPTTDVIRNVFEKNVISIKSHGARVTIIDFTNSRMNKDGTIIFLDLSTDEELFQGEGDYQFDIYRMMKERNNNAWEDFKPVTNMLWLHYLATKLFSSKKIQMKRRKQILLKMEELLKHGRIKVFLEDQTMKDIFKEFVVVE